MVFAIAALVLSTLALFSHGYVLDDSCWDYPRETRDGIRDAMAESKLMGELGQSYVTQPADAFDNTRSEMFFKTRAVDLRGVQGMAQPNPR
jgi:hypothetical protein